MGNEVKRSIKHSLDRIVIFREKQDVSKQCAGRLLPRDSIDPVRPSLLQKKQCLQACERIFSYARKLPGKRSSVRPVLIAETPHIGDFVAEHRRTLRCKPRNSGFAGAGNACKNEGGAPVNGTGCVQQESTFLGQHKRMSDAQNRIDRVRIGGLPDKSAGQRGIKCRGEGPSIHVPLMTRACYLSVLVQCPSRLHEFDLKLIGPCCARTHESFIALQQKVAENCTFRPQKNWDAADLDSDIKLDRASCCRYDGAHYHWLSRNRCAA